MWFAFLAVTVFRVLLTFEFCCVLYTYLSIDCFRESSLTDEFGLELFLVLGFELAPETYALAEVTGLRRVPSACDIEVVL